MKQGRIVLSDYLKSRVIPNAIAGYYTCEVEDELIIHFKAKDGVATYRYGDKEAMEHDLDLIDSVMDDYV